MHHASKSPMDAAMLVGCNCCCCCVAERSVAHSMRDDQALLSSDLPQRILRVLSAREHLAEAG